ncbi:hypothetical protein T02_16434 [Trichinella nativa]|uniref:Uncharacterized protein n=1 Tax=Trichinella nativa TaxID=6335 RepID=A0A0V1KIP4_9BILA|nr:hypothetical protein T02_16434 [Trichinella nativa]
MPFLRLFYLHPLNLIILENTTLKAHLHKRL